MRSPSYRSRFLLLLLSTGCHKTEEPVPPPAQGTLVSKGDRDAGVDNDARATGTVSRNEGVADSKCSAQGSARIGALTPYGQQAPLWCWAAVSKMVLGAYNIEVEQCGIVQSYLDSKDPSRKEKCCSEEFCSNGMWDQGRDDPCNREGVPYFGKYYQHSKFTDAGTALPWPDLVAQLQAGSPVLFTWIMGAGTGHVMVAFGYEEIGSTHWVRIIDPMSTLANCEPEARLITYEEFVSGFDHVHNVDEFAFEFRATGGGSI